MITEGATSELLAESIMSSAGSMSAAEFATAAAVSNVAAGVAGAVAGSIASQAVGVSIGAQDSFSWKGVALAAVSGGVSSGLGSWAPLGSEATVGNAIVRSAVGSSLTQGIAVATGLQSSFNWRSVAASAVGAGVGSAVGGALGNANAFNDLGAMGQRFAIGAVSGLAGGATVAVMRGGRVSATQIAADAFGNALGGSLAGANGQQAQGVGPWSDADYRNGSDIQDDNYNPAYESSYRNGSDLQSDNVYYDRMTHRALASGGPTISDSATNAEVMAYNMRQREYGPDWKMTPVADTGAVKPAIDDDRDPTSKNYRNEMDRASDAAKKPTVIDSTKQVYTLENLAGMPSWKIQGAGDPELASAMTKMQGERDKATGEWIPYDQSKTGDVLATVVRVRGIDADRAASDYQTMLDLRNDAERAALAAGQKTGSFDELNKNEHRVPLLSMSAANGLPDNSAHMASIEQLRFGKMVGDALGGLDPVFGALLSPTGGIPGAGNVRVTSASALAAAGGIEVVTNHGIAHDAAGYLLNYQGMGPGYQYVPGNSGLFFSTKNPLGGQVSGLTLYNNVRLYGTPTAPGR